MLLQVSSLQFIYFFSSCINVSLFIIYTMFSLLNYLFNCISHTWNLKTFIMLSQFSLSLFSKSPSHIFTSFFRFSVSLFIPCPLDAGFFQIDGMLKEGKTNIYSPKLSLQQEILLFKVQILKYYLLLFIKEQLKFNVIQKTLRKLELKYLESFETWCWRKMEKIKRSEK